MATPTTTPRKATQRRRPAATKVEETTVVVEAEEAKPTERYAFPMVVVPREDRIGRKTQQGHEVKTVRSEKFVPPADSGVTGALYFPIGTTRVKVIFEGEAE